MPRSAPSREVERAAKLLGAKVAARRSELELTQEQLAERAGIGRNQIQNIEHSRSSVKDPTTGRPGPGNARLDTVSAWPRRSRWRSPTSSTLLSPS
ncbi:helix-turn-helix transcriptional regulator [Janibacter anophelis]|uniref:helix-turn-helix transcriptional regulator n=1 Tax=Janibacter anophelis TaxID=319054 RepID=UPI003F7F54E0